MLCIIFRLDFFQNSFDFCFETKPKFQINVERRERQKKMKMHITEKQREKYFKSFYLVKHRCFCFKNIKFDNGNCRNIKKLVNVLMKYLKSRYALKPICNNSLTKRLECEDIKSTHRKSFKLFLFCKCTYNN